MPFSYTLSTLNPKQLPTCTNFSLDTSRMCTLPSKRERLFMTRHFLIKHFLTYWSIFNLVIWKWTIYWTIKCNFSTKTKWKSTVHSKHFLPPYLNFLSLRKKLESKNIFADFSEQCPKITSIDRRFLLFYKHCFVYSYSIFCDNFIGIPLKYEILVV